MALDQTMLAIAETARRWLDSRRVPSYADADFEWRNEDGFSPLHIACQQGHYKACEYLLRLGHSLTAEVPSHLNATPFMLAVFSGRVHFAVWMQSTIGELGLDKTSGPIQFVRNSRGLSAFMFACMSKSTWMAQLLLHLTGPGELSYRDSSGRTALMYTAANANAEVIDWVASHLSDDEVAASCRQTTHSLLVYAACNRERFVLRHLFDQPRYKAPALIEVGIDIVFNAVMAGTLNVLEYVRDKLGTAWLFGLNLAGLPWPLVAAQNGKSEVLKWFNKKWPKLIHETIDDNGHNAFLHAVYGGHMHVLMWLKNECNMDPSRQAYKTGSAAMMAASRGHKDVLKWLVAHNCPLVHVDPDYDVSTSAVENGSVAWLEWICANYGHALPGFEKNGDIHRAKAAIGGHLEILKWLHAKGHLNTDDAKVVAFHACTKDQVAVVAWLLDVFGSKIVYDGIVNGTSRIIRTIDNGAIQIMSLYLTAECVRQTERVICVFYAARRGSVKALKVMKAHGLSLLVRNVNGTTLVMAAAKAGKLDCVKWLLKQGCPLINKDANEKTTLQYAIEGGNEAVIAFVTQSTGYAVSL